jgi:hypothetical protein
MIVKAIPNMKNPLFYLAVILVSMVQINPAQAQTVGSNDQAVTMLKEFYTSYITLVASDSNTDKQLVSLQKKYCTVKLITRLPKILEQRDSDPFLNAQDSQVDYLKTLTVKRDVKKAGHYIVSYDHGKIIINLTVVNVGSTCKIDSVW